MSQFECLLYDVEDGIATITLNRPDRMNAITYPMTRELIAAFDQTDSDDTVRAVIVTGSGDRAFCAGADLATGGEAFDYAKRTDQGERPMINGVYPDSGGQVALRIFDSLKPVIGAINGVAVGFGSTILLPMDVRICAADARFGFPFVRRGIVPESASAWFLPRIVGISTALDWCLTGRLFDAEEAARERLVRSVHPRSDLMNAALEIARVYVDNAAPVSVALSRQLLWKMLGADHPMEAHKLDSRGVMTLGQSADAREGVASFMEKRTANFQDRVSENMPPFYPWWGERPFE